MTSTTVEDELKEKRNDYKERMERVKKREQQLKDERQHLQEKLVQFYKYIQDNEIKRLRATKKANAEEAAKKERYEKIVELSQELERLERAKHESRDRYLQFAKYERYLNDVLHHNDGEEYAEARDIIARYRTLDENRNLLKKRKTQLERTRTESKMQLSVQQQRSKNESVELQNTVNELQTQLEELQRAYKKMQYDLELSVTHKSTTTKTIGQVRMACQNLFDRCQAVNQQYRGRVARDEGEDDMLVQLGVIGDCLEDYQWIVQEWRKRTRPAKADDTAGATSPVSPNTGAGGAATGSKR